MEIYKPTNNFNFENFTLVTPQPIQGGSFITRIQNSEDKPMYIQLPKCSTKQGVIKTNRGLYCDLIYDRNSCDHIVDWLLNLEKYCQEKISEKKNVWFTNEMTDDDIESMMTPAYRLYKSGKSLLIRTFLEIDKGSNTEKCMIYDENENKQTISCINNNVNIIPLIKVEGIKFTTKSIDIEIKLVQIMVLNKEPEIMQTCMIKKDNLSKTKQQLENKDILVNTTENTHETEKAENTDATDNTHVTEKADTTDNTHVTEKADTTDNTDATEKADTTDNTDATEKAENTDATENTDAIENADETEKGNQPEDIKIDNTTKSLKNDTLDTKNNDTIKETITSILDYENTNHLEEITVKPDEDYISIKDSNVIYQEIYRAARVKAKKMRQETIKAFLEAKKIKTQYMLDDTLDSDSEDISDEELSNY